MTTQTTHSQNIAERLAYYAQPGPVTDPGIYGLYLDPLPTDFQELCNTLQGLLVHIFWARRYGLALSDQRKNEVNLRAVSRQLARMLELADYPLNEPRPLEKRLVGNCRDFSTLMCAALRHHGIPARARCGFATYFTPGHFEDHWICEAWDTGQGRWVRIDAQLDQLQRETLRISFNPLDVPSDQFLTGGQAWLVCRAGEQDPHKFGIFDMHGMGFIRGDLIRDFLALNKIEILPWDEWPILKKPLSTLSETEINLLDQMARLTLDAGTHFADIRSLYEQQPLLKASPDWQP